MIGSSFALQMGCAYGLATMLSVGPTNLTVLREGLMRGRIWLVVGLYCLVSLGLMLPAYFVSDVLGEVDPGLRNLLAWVAVGVMLYFAYKSFRAASGRKALAFDTETRETAWACARRVLPIMLLNPLAHLELFFVPAAIFQTLEEPRAPFDFIAGVMVVSFLGFCGYGFGGRSISRVINRKGGRRVFDRTCGVVLSGLAAALAVSLVAQ